MQILSPQGSFIESFSSQAFNILRGRVDVNQYYLIIVLLFLRKEGVFNNVTRFKPENMREDILRSVAILDIQNNENYQIIKRIFEEFREPIYRLDPYTLCDLLQLIESVDKNYLDVHIGELVENLIYKIARSEGRFGGEYLQPLELTQFICALADLPRGAKVYNPFAGLASFGVYLNKEARYYGQELNRRSWAIGMIRLLAANKEPYSDFILGDSIKDWNPTGAHYDLIVANPPFNYKIQESYATDTRYVDSFFLKCSMSALTANGKAVIVFADNFLYAANDEQKSIRRFLVTENLLETVISFPGGLLLNTDIPFSVLVISNSKHYKHKVKFVDAESSIYEFSKKDKRIDVQRLIDTVFTEGASNTALVSKEEIIFNDFNLKVGRYVETEAFKFPAFDNARITTLGELLTPKTSFGRKVRLGRHGSVVWTKNLKNSRFDYRLDVSGIEDTKLTKQLHFLDRSSILFTLKGKSPKPTYFHYQGKPVYLSPDILACEVKEDLVDVSYLVNELHQNYVIQQINKYLVGNTVPYISKEDFLNIKIVLPPLEEQKAKIQGVKEEFVKNQVLQAEKDAIALGVKDAVYQNFSTIKHSMGMPLLNLNSGIKNIEETLNRLIAGWESFKVDDDLNYTLRDAFNSLSDNLTLISNLLKNNERHLEMSNYSMIKIDIVEFLEKYVSDLKQTASAEFKVELDISPDLTSEAEARAAINGNCELLIIALNNIVDNAVKHGFVQRGKDYRIKFRLSLFMEAKKIFIRLEVANNGKPFPVNYSLEKLIRRNSSAGATGNTGIGGYDINEIVKHHEGKLDLVLNNNIADDFATVYEILIPIYSNGDYNG
jgi:type I restriction enzyme M protein